MSKKTAEERFMEKVRKDPVTGCWLWTSGCNNSGYAEFRFERQTWRAHRWAYMHFIGDPGDLFVCHTCDTPSCVNPVHLWLGTNADNMQDAKAKNRMATGDRNGSRLHPGRRPRGEAHYSQTQPERLLRGEDNGRAKLTWESVRDIRSRYAASGVTLRSLAVEYDVSSSMISLVVNHKNWIEKPTA